MVYLKVVMTQQYVLETYARASGTPVKDYEERGFKEWVCGNRTVECRRRLAAFPWAVYEWYADPDGVARPELTSHAWCPDCARKQGWLIPDGIVRDAYIALRLVGS